mmetsp:Transcript_107100/g.190298  ORF Transcript_107100/g.190298 Transcript_107100/m.190298 type:complete len:358 (-) Transcript_107100:54-1127(-)|eukprot:CAMPEP_0197652006 /NCGR_PEP_ID=MMETSP1338-20131121/34185_1 /TAXON_ID=43686 ORGANISM="Pelagodinium beii, Strain RCC1491" /NCGR_SAMPLE_ID=MMETSP1338 /ASSEMBLY_ACC=CAM_ASM_000754 /LENGTH=357 /DNA_ID=CAMNT_0043226787 /DNA_START=41 /DNA_END=1114 /DNA_ORIENTATION=-
MSWVFLAFAGSLAQEACDPGVQFLQTNVRLKEAGQTAARQHLQRHQRRDMSDEDRDLMCNTEEVPFDARSGKQIRWLHVPKTGTTFGNTVWHYGCPSLPDDVSLSNYSSNYERKMNKDYPISDCSLLLDHSPGTHKPIGDEEWKDDTFVTLLRKPASRICSAYNYGKQCIVDCNPENDKSCFQVRMLDNAWYWLLRRGETCTFMHASADLLEYGSQIDTTSCTAKMVLGQSCNAPETLSDEQIQLALNRIQKFAFVGLQEEWKLSVCLFHRIFGGPSADQATKLIALETESLRETDSRASGNANCSDQRLLDELTDTADSQLYALAETMFWNQAEAVLSLLKSQRNNAVAAGMKKQG